MNTSTLLTIHWSAMSISLTKESTLKLSETSTRREVFPPHEKSSEANAFKDKIYLNSKKEMKIIT